MNCLTACRLWRGSTRLWCKGFFATSISTVGLLWHMHSYTWIHTEHVPVLSHASSFYFVVTVMLLSYLHCPTYRVYGPVISNKCCESLPLIPLPCLLLVVKCILVASPGFVKDQFITYLFKEAVRQDNKVLLENRPKFMLVHSSSGHKYSLKGRSY